VIFFVIHFLQVVKAGWNDFRAMVTGYEIATMSQSSSEKPNPSVLAKGTL